MSACEKNDITFYKNIFKENLSKEGSRELKSNPNIPVAGLGLWEEEVLMMWGLFQ